MNNIWLKIGGSLFASAQHIWSRLVHMLHGLSAAVSQINLNASLPSLSFNNNKVWSQWACKSGGLSLRNVIMVIMVISNLWRHHVHVRCRSAHQLSSSTQVKHRTAQQFAVSSRWQHWKPEEKPFPWHNLHQQFWLVRPTFRPGDSLDVRKCPDPVKGLVWRLPLDY